MNRTVIIEGREDTQVFLLHEAILKLAEDMSLGFELKSDVPEEYIFEKFVSTKSGGLIKAVIKYRSEKSSDLDLFGVAIDLILERGSEHKIKQNYEKFCADTLCSVLTLSQRCRDWSLQQLCEFLTRHENDPKYTIELHQDLIAQKGVVS